MKRTLALTLATALLTPALALAGTVFEMEMRQPEGPTEATRLMVEGTNLRTDQELGADGARRSMIFRGDAEEVWILDHAKPETMVIDRRGVEQMAARMAEMKQQMEQAMANVPPEQRAMMEKMMQGQMQGMPSTADQPPLEVRRTSETGTTDEGWEWTKYEVFRGTEKVAEYLAADWDELDLEPGDFDAFREMQGFFQTLMESFGDAFGGRMDFDTPFAEMAEIDGFPVVTRQFTDGRMTREVVLESVESTDLPADTFSDPGYPRQRLEMPSAGR